jgi:hypothetical protein
MTCEPREGYIAIRRDPVTKEKFKDNQYVFINKTSIDDELWLVCLRGERAGEALRYAIINEEEWIINELDGWDDEVDVYYINNSAPMDLDYLRDEIDNMLRMSINDEIEPTIKVEHMSREAYLRITEMWNAVNDTLRENPEAFMDKFIERIVGATK